ncbi:MAG: (d)CMP kinase [Alphaproteobacteria bacterium]|nr:MAG: (d)CMP kinase [Alphaproteobacteria bacterium]
MSYYVSIAIDGPAASGKSSVGLELSKSLRYLFLDTGVMYRAITWAALKNKIDINDEAKISKLASQLDIKINQPSLNDGRTNDIFVDGQDITRKITEKNVNENVSQVSKYKGVRNSLTKQQQKIALKGNIVMVGRDIGTVVLPRADYKFFLNASSQERAKRRHLEEIKKGGNPNFEEIQSNIMERDRIDTTRIFAPLIPAKDAQIINTDNKTIDQVVEEILLAIEEITPGFLK